jgi:hypothetical protein
VQALVKNSRKQIGVQNQRTLWCRAKASGKSKKGERSEKSGKGEKGFRREPPDTLISFAF